MSARPLAPRHILLAKGPFRSLRRGGCSQPSSFSLTGSRALSRAAIYIVRSGWPGGLLRSASYPCVCGAAVPLATMFVRQVSRLFGTPFLQRGPFASLWRGGCSQPSLSPSRAPERFRESASDFSPGRVVWPDFGLQATPGSVASQCLWPCCFRQVSRRSERFPLGQVLLVHLGGAPVHRRPILPRGLRGVFESHTSYFYTGWLGGLTVVCRLPLSLWLLSASGRPFCAPVLSFTRHFRLAARSFLPILAWRSFATVSFSLAGTRTSVESAIFPLTPDSSEASSGLQATPESVAPQCLLAAYLLRQGLTPVSLRMLVVCLGRLAESSTPHCTSRFLHRVSQSLILPWERRHGNLRSGCHPCLSGSTAPPGCSSGTPTAGCLRRKVVSRRLSFGS